MDPSPSARSEAPNHGKPPSSGFSVVVPVYRSEATLAPLVAGILEAAAQLQCDCEVVLVDDGSKDRSWDTITSLAAANPNVRGIRLMRNFGQHNALLCGIRAARFPVTLTMDDDLQHPPGEIPVLLAAIEQGADLVYGVPVELQHGLVRNALSFATKALLSKLMGISQIRSISAFRAFRTHVRGAFESFHGPSLVLDVLLSWGASRIEEVRVKHAPRAVGRSNYTIGRLVRQFLLVLTGFSTIPLRLASVLGGALAAFGGVLLVWVLVGAFTGRTQVAGFPFLAATITIFSGAQLLALGILGEYVAGIHTRLLDRPPYAIGQQTKGPSSP